MAYIRQDIARIAVDMYRAISRWALHIVAHGVLANRPDASTAGADLIDNVR